MSKDVLSLAAYLAALGVGCYLTARGLLDKSVLATLIGAAVTMPWQRPSGG